MRNFKGLREYNEGGLSMEGFYPSNDADSNMIEESFSDGKKRNKGSKTARRNNQSRPCLNCHKRNT